VTTKVATTRTSEILLYDKLKAIEMLTRITGAGNDFDQAIAALSTYDLIIKKDKKTGEYFIAE
jgi:hypothetical protein